MFENIRRDLAWVPRWSIIRVNRRQSVAEHCYFVACYGLHIAERINWPDPADIPMSDRHFYRNALAVYLLRHDDAEAVTGDIASPIKRLSGFDESKLVDIVKIRFGRSPVPTWDMKLIRKAADSMDECMYLAGEINLGNMSVRSSLRNSTERLRLAVSLLPGRQELKNDLMDTMRTSIDAEMSYDKDLSGLELL